MTRITLPLPLPLALLILGVAGFLAGPSRAHAWGQEGHAVTARIAEHYLTAKVRATLDALLASDTDTLTAPDFASRAAWADRYRNGHRETSLWHYVDVEIDSPDPAGACFGYPAMSPGQAASAGPARDCVVNKIAEFEAELRNPATPAPERLLALKFLIHFIGDVHQPLHAADHDDRGGNCVAVLTSSDAAPSNLHAYWDTAVVARLGETPDAVAAKLIAKITPRDVAAWTPRGEITQAAVLEWAAGSLAAAESSAYDLPERPNCGAHAAPELLTQAYQEKAEAAAALSLEQAGVRLAAALNYALM